MRELDWVAKRQMIESYMERKGCGWNDPRVRLMDLQYHDVRPEKGLYYTLERSHLIERIVQDSRDRQGGVHAADRARAPISADGVSESSSKSIYGASWTSVLFDVGNTTIKKVPLMDPLRGTESLTAELLDQSDTAEALLGQAESLNEASFPPQSRRREFLQFPDQAASRSLTPGGRRWPDVPSVQHEPARPVQPVTVPHATTVLAIKYQEGVVIAGDRRATEGFQIAERRIEKVFKIDGYSAMAIAGAAGPCIEMARLFQTELEHYEKLEGVQLSCEGKANKLGQMVKANLPMVFHGLVVMPLYVGYDLRRSEGRIFKYDITGGRYEESEYHAIGSGGKDARNTMREHIEKAWQSPTP